MNPRPRTVPRNRRLARAVALLLACALCGPSCGVVTAKQVVSSESRFAAAKGATPVPGGKDVIALTQGNKVGYRVMELPCTDQHGKRTTTAVAVWYPTDDPERPFDYPFGKNKVKTQVAENGKVAAGRFPLVIHSHGATGSGLNSFFITETMARHGIIVVAVDHTDDFYLARIPASWKAEQERGQAIKALAYGLKVRNKWLDEEAVASRPVIAYRPAQIRAAIDFMLSASKDPGSPFSGRIDESKIGVMGHSFGGWTTMAVAGGVKSMADPRIRAAIAFSEVANDKVFSAQEVSGITVPLMIMFGSTEVEQGRGDDRTFFYDRLPGPKYMVEIQDAVHTTFSIKEEHPDVAGYLGEANRAAITRYAVAFMAYYLKGDAQAHEQLKVRGSGVSNYISSE
jgi:predicted dienelactone hydrolase